MDITIDITEDFMVVEYERLPKSRRVWAGPGVNIYVRGPLSEKDYDAAQHMAQTVCDDMHIPVGSLRLVDTRVKKQKTAVLSTNTKKMF